MKPATSMTQEFYFRLYVCISGAADQLQTNFAGDFRHILKYVFVMNATQEVGTTMQEVSGTMLGYKGTRQWPIYCCNPQ